LEERKKTEEEEEEEKEERERERGAGASPIKITAEVGQCSTPLGEPLRSAATFSRQSAHRPPTAVLASGT